VQGTATPANAAVVSTMAAPVVDSAALASGLGGGITAATPESVAPAPSINASRFVLTGVVAATAKSQGIALIAVDGKPARPYRIGGQVTDGVVLQSVDSRLAVLASEADAPAGLTLELPKLATAIVGTAIPATPVPQPAYVPPAPPVVIPPSVSQSATSVTGANPEATPGATSGQSPARAGAIRGRGGAFGKDAGNREAPKDDQ
jgi:general secretion pathway protein C